MAPEQLGSPDWAALKVNHPAKLVEAIRETLKKADSSIIDPKLLEPPLDGDVAATIRILEELAILGVLVPEEQHRCGNCDTLASAEDQAVGTCPACNSRYAELASPFTTRRVFKLPGGRESRDISWVVTVHGMNTDGPWQQDFSWLIANKLKYSAPVLILKYPIFRVMTLFERTQRLLVTDLGRRLKAAIAHAQQRGDELRSAPDVVLHSYGTLLFSRLLLEDEFADLKFGRVLMAGSIVPPDYDWAQHTKSGRIEQVINHCGDKDWEVGIAELFIPGSGPSGRGGFVDTEARNVLAAGFGHGTFFEIEPMRTNLNKGGPWDRFLTYPPRAMAGDGEMEGPATWSPSAAAAFARLVLKALSPVLGPLIWLAMELISAIRAVIAGK